jgi:hypothetical protein
MAKLLSDRSAQRLGPALDAIESSAPRKGRSPRRRIRSNGAGSVRSWVVITGVTDAANYTGDVYDFPEGEAVENNVIIQVLGATQNPFQTGYGSFADKSTNAQGDEIYFIDGYLLG